ncbi:MAG: NAD(P)H-binding protein [Pseudomonadales bacterium]|nr:NAD(P)H-binding protein [Pseudomonadales bacterium]
MTTRIVVFGATGKAGNAIVSQALERGWTVRTMVRDPAKLTITHQRLDSVRGHIGDPTAIRAALAGQWAAVVSALGIYSKTPSTELSEGTRRIAAEMRGAAIKRIVVVSSLGAGDSHGQGTFAVRMIQKYILRETLRDKTRQEEVLRGSNLDWTSLRPPQLTEDPRVRGDLVAWQGLAPANRKLTWKVSRATLAKYVLDAVEKNLWVREAVNLSEPK